MAKKANQIQKKEANISKSSGLFQTNLSTELDQVDMAVALTSYFSGNMQELDEKCYSRMEKTSNRHANGQSLYRCKVCGKEEIKLNMKSHIEANHLEGVSIPCNLCEKTFRSRPSLNMHNRRNH